MKISWNGFSKKSYHERLELLRAQALLSPEKQTSLIDTMQKAQETRLGYNSYWNSFKSLGALVSTIFLRSLDKSETLQHSLDSRGYTGELPVYTPKKRDN